MGRVGNPAVNIKVHWNGQMSDLLPLVLGQVGEPGETTFRNVTSEPGFTEAWIEAHLTESMRESWWQDACQEGFDDAKGLAEEMLDTTEVCQEGRSGGWLVVHGITAVGCSPARSTDSAPRSRQAASADCAAATPAVGCPARWRSARRGSRCRRRRR
jgi:hypothetical protein